MSAVANLKTSKSINLAQAFGFEVDTGSALQVQQAKHPEYIPTLNPDYVIKRNKTFLKIINYISGLKKRGIWMSGPTGSGKTSLIEQMYARLEMPLIVVSCGPSTTYEDLFGYRDLENGSTKFVEGPVVFAMTHGYGLVLDEIDRLDDELMVKMNGFLQAGPDGTHNILLENDNMRIVKSSPGFRLFSTANTNGSGDFSGNYNSRTQDLASRSRFDFIEALYPSPEVEEEILRSLVKGKEVEAEARAKAAATKAGKQFKGLPPLVEPALLDEVIPSLVKAANLSRFVHNGTTPKAMAALKPHLDFDGSNQMPKGVSQEAWQKVSQAAGGLISVLTTRQLISALEYFILYRKMPEIEPMQMAFEEVFLDGLPIDEQEAVTDIIALALGDIWYAKNPAFKLPNGDEANWLEEKM